MVLEGITVGGKTLREHLEVINHREAIAYVEEIVHKEEPLSEWQIKNLDRLVLKGIDITKNVFSLNNWNLVFGNEFWFYKLTIFREYRALIIKAPQTVVTGTFLLYQEL